MPKYRINDNETGKTFVLEGDSPPTEKELKEIVLSMGVKSGNIANDVADKPLPKKARVGKAAGAVVGGAIGSMFGPIGGITGSLLGDKVGKFTAENPREAALNVLDTLPSVGGTAGAIAGAGLGSIPLGMLLASGGEGFRQVGRRALGAEVAPAVETGIPGLQFPRVPGVQSEMSNLIEQGAMSGLIDSATLGAGKVAKLASPVFHRLQAKAAGSAMGGMKNVYNKVRGGSKAFNEAAVKMQDLGAFGAFTSPTHMEEFVKNKSMEAGTKIGDIIKEVSGTEWKIDSHLLSKEIYKDLRNPIRKGYGKEQNDEVRKIMDTITGMRKRNITLKDLQTIKAEIDPGKWGDFQRANQGKDARKIYDLRKRAYGKLSDVIEQGVELYSGPVGIRRIDTPTSTPTGQTYSVPARDLAVPTRDLAVPTRDLAPSMTQEAKSAGRGPMYGEVYDARRERLIDDFKAAKKMYGASETIKTGLRDKIDRLEGRQFLGLGEVGSSIGALVSLFGGNPASAAKWLATAAGIKYLRSFGPQQGAMIFRALSNMRPNPTAMGSVLRVGRYLADRSNDTNRKN